MGRNAAGTLANAVIWAAVILASAHVLDEAAFDQLLPILGGGAAASVVIVGGATLRRRSGG